MVNVNVTKIENQMHLSDSELILNPDGSIYHLCLQPEQVAPTIITVGDQDRVSSVSKHFDRIDHVVSKREFLTHTGIFNGHPITVISTGIGTDNIDIVFNELDALLNIDLAERKIKEAFQEIRFIRIGTSGALQADIDVDSFLVSSEAIGLDALLHYYDLAYSNKELLIRDAFKAHMGNINDIYCAEGSNALIQRFGDEFLKGITITAPGFYGPQGRRLRLKTKDALFFDKITDFNIQNNRITNLEMETAGIYGMARLLGHQAVSCNALLANRSTGQFSKTPKETVDQLIEKVLGLIF